MNLLPVEYKSEIKFEAWRRYVVYLGLALMLIGVVANALLLPSFLFLSYRIGQSQDELDALQNGRTFREVKKGAERVDKINGILTRIIGFHKNSVNMSDLMNEMFSGVPSGIKLSAFSANTDDATIKLTGNSKVREKLRSYIDELKSKPYVAGGIDITPPNYEIMQKDINFTITMRFNKDKLP